MDSETSHRNAGHCLPEGRRRHSQGKGWTTRTWSEPDPDRFTTTRVIPEAGSDEPRSRPGLLPPSEHVQDKCPHGAHGAEESASLGPTRGLWKRLFKGPAAGTLPFLAWKSRGHCFTHPISWAVWKARLLARTEAETGWGWGGPPDPGAWGVVEEGLLPVSH